MQTIFAKSETPNHLAMNVTPSTFTTAEPVENGNTNRALVDALVSSKTYRDYERAFGDLTGLPVALQPVETWQLPHHGKRNENEFCSLLSKKSRACAACLQVQEKLCQEAAEEADSIVCPVKTVEVHRANIKEKLALKTATELVRYAVRWVDSQGQR